MVKTGLQSVFAYSVLASSKLFLFFSVLPSVITPVAAMGLHRVALSEAKFSEQEDVRKFPQDVGIYATVKEWTYESRLVLDCEFQRRRESLVSPTVGDSKEKFLRIIDGSKAIQGVTSLVKE